MDPLDQLSPSCIFTFEMPPMDQAPEGMPLQRQLFISRQSSLAIENFSKNGIQKRLHVVVKNQPFLIQLAATSNEADGFAINFNKYPIEARLLYDCDDLKEVGFVKCKPLEYKCHVNEKGDQVTVELRVKVLTSQLEDMHFRVKFTAMDPITKTRIESICVLSESIKVVSKPEQVKKKKPLPEIGQQKKKRNVNDVLSDTLSRIETTCLQQQQVLSKLFEQQEIQQTQSNALIQTLCSMVVDNATRHNLEVLKAPECEKKQQQQQKAPQTDFEIAFQKFVESYNKIQADERPEKIRKVIRNTSTRDTQKLIELLNTMTSETCPREATIEQKNASALGGCRCADCPHKKELERIDDFYNEFLSSPTAML